MYEKINEPVSVVTIYDHQSGSFIPQGLKWNGYLYKVSQLKAHRKVKRGHTLHHEFQVIADTLNFKLDMETENLTWTLREIGDDKHQNTSS